MCAVLSGEPHLAADIFGQSRRFRIPGRGAERSTIRRRPTGAPGTPGS